MCSNYGMTEHFQYRLFITDLIVPSGFNISITSMVTKSDQYLLDSSVATLILDGELWDREPYKLLGHRKELRLQLEQCSIFKVYVM